MKGVRYLYTGGIALALVIAFGLWKPLAKADRDDEHHRRVPKFRVDPFWPKPLPAPVDANGIAHRWVTGEVGGSCTDADDNVFTVNRGFQTGGLVGQDGSTSIPSPPIVEYDPEGNVANAWGDPSKNADGTNKVLPNGIHGCFVDYQDNVWIAGNGDGVVQKWSHDGSTLLATIGTKLKCDSPTFACGEATAGETSHTLLNDPADLAVDPQPDPKTGNPGSVYIADGYGNHRVVVFGTTDGVNYTFLRQFGTKCTTTPCGSGTFGATSGGHPHCVVLGNDGLVYACDRPNNRIEVFDKLGNFEYEIDVNPPTQSTPTVTLRACDIDFYPNIDYLASLSPTHQRFILDADLGSDQTWILDNEGPSSTVIGAVGRCGLKPCPGHNVGEFAFGHTVNVDSEGNAYVAETITGRRIQKFVRVRHEEDEHHDDD